MTPGISQETDKSLMCSSYQFYTLSIGIGISYYKEGSATYWMYGSSEQIYIQAGGERVAILQATQEGGQVSVDFRSTRSSRRTEKILDNTASIETTPASYADSTG